MIPYRRAKKLIECNPLLQYNKATLEQIDADFSTLLHITKKDSRTLKIASHIGSQMTRTRLHSLPKPVMIMLFETLQFYARSHWDNEAAEKGKLTWRYRWFSDRVEFPDDWHKI